MCKERGEGCVKRGPGREVCKERERYCEAAYCRDVSTPNVLSRVTAKLVRPSL